MTSEAAAASPTTNTGPPDGLDKLGAVAVAVITTHTDGGGRCRYCGLPWPCERARLAEHNLAAL